MTDPVRKGAGVDDLGYFRDLTSREREVLAMVAAGLSAKQIGLKLAIAPKTVERHIDHVKMKTQAKNRPHMIAVAFALGLIDSGEGAAALQV